MKFGDIRGDLLERTQSLTSGSDSYFMEQKKSTNHLLRVWYEYYQMRREMSRTASRISFTCSETCLLVHHFNKLVLQAVRNFQNTLFWENTALHIQVPVWRHVPKVISALRTKLNGYNRHPKQPHTPTISLALYPWNIWEPRKDCQLRVNLEGRDIEMAT